MKSRRPTLFSQVTCLLVATTLTATQAGCIVSSTETVNTDKVFLLGPKTESEPGIATRDVTMKAVSALRNQFGGHTIEREPPSGGAAS